jgi:putative phage-type endonuclease
MTTFWNDLNDLEDIIDTIEPAKSNICEIEDDLKESLYLFLKEYMSINIHIYKDPYFEDIIYNYLHSKYSDFYSEIINDNDLSIIKIISDVIECYFIINTPRSYKNTFTIGEPDVKSISKKIKNYENMEQPPQQTPEWYQFRWTCLTASSIWKALDTESNKNQLIVSKCVPVNPKKYSSVNTSSAIHNGHRFEPLSTMWYEDRFNTTVGEFGCIRHPEIEFLGASPDGINIDPTNPRYGRALEIKNPVNRILTGIPKKDYWIQMQLQMEVWDLETCDFLETCFKCYDNEDEFNKDGKFNKNKDGKLKGIIVQFYENGKPTYKYPPIGCDKLQFDEWYDKTLDDNTNLTWTQNIYWWLDSWSCVLVPRNKKWFEYALPHFEKLWKIIIKERNNGEFEKRKPKKRERKKEKPTISFNLDDIELDNNVKQLFPDLPDTPKVIQGTPVVKIRTQSFNDSKNQT